MSWLEPEIERFEHELRMQNGEKARIRTLDDTRATKFFVHQAPMSWGKRVDVLCVGKNAGCPMCAANDHPMAQNLKDGQDKPYASRPKFGRAVWVYTIGPITGEGQVTMVGKPRLLIGMEVWKGINDIREAHGSHHDRDIIMMRKKTDRVRYSAHAEAPSPFTEQVDWSTVPKIESYMDFLRERLKDVTLYDMEKWVPTMKDGGGAGYGRQSFSASVQSAGGFTPTQPAPQGYQPQPYQAPQGAPASLGAPQAPAPQAVPAPAPAPAPVQAASTDPHQEAVNKMYAMTRRKMDVDKLMSSMKQVTQGAANKGKFEDFSIEELAALEQAYGKAVGLLQ